MEAALNPRRPQRAPIEPKYEPKPYIFSEEVEKYRDGREVCYNCDTKPMWLPSGYPTCFNCNTNKHIQLKIREDPKAAAYRKLAEDTERMVAALEDDDNDCMDCVFININASGFLGADSSFCQAHITANAEYFTTQPARKKARICLDLTLDDNE